MKLLRIKFSGITYLSYSQKWVLVTDQEFMLRNYLNKPGLFSKNYPTPKSASQIRDQIN